MPDNIFALTVEGTVSTCRIARMIRTLERQKSTVVFALNVILITVASSFWVLAVVFLVGGNLSYGVDSCGRKWFYHLSKTPFKSQDPRPLYFMSYDIFWASQLFWQSIVKVFFTDYSITVFLHILIRPQCKLNQSL